MGKQFNKETSQKVFDTIFTTVYKDENMMMSNIEDQPEEKYQNEEQINQRNENENENDMIDEENNQNN